MEQPISFFGILLGYLLSCGSLFLVVYSLYKFIRLCFYTKECSVKVFVISLIISLPLVVASSVFTMCLMFYVFPLITISNNFLLNIINDTFLFGMIKIFSMYAFPMLLCIIVLFIIDSLVIKSRLKKIPYYISIFSWGLVCLSDTYHILAESIQMLWASL